MKPTDRGAMTDFPEMNPREFIAQYVIEVRARGVLLPYNEYGLIERWLELAQHDVDKLLLLLSEILPTYFQPDAHNGRVKGLTGIDKKITQQLRELSFRNS
jgi:hypothetical protein